MINLISDWHEAGVPVFLNARNRTQADQCRELLDDLMIETEVEENESPMDTSSWLEALQTASSTESSKKHIGP